MDYFSKSRIEAFSDGVFAIIVTLLVLEIKVPHLVNTHSVVELAHALIVLLPKVLSWIISFLIVCVIWVNHHRIIAQLKHITHRIFWLNATLLLWCSFIPFPTALVGDYIHNPMALFLYGVILCCMSFTFTLLRWHVLANPGLLQSGTNLQHFRMATTRSLLFGPILYLTGSALAFLHPWIAIMVYALIPLYFIFYNWAPTRLD